MKHSSFDATTSALDAETSALDVETSAYGAATSAIARRSFDATMPRRRRSAWQRRRSCGVTGDIGTEFPAIAGVGITPQMCNRATNHGDTSTFSKPV